MSTTGTPPPAPIPLPEDQISHDYVIFISVASMMTLISTACVVLRFLSRRISGLQWDDWASLGSLVFAYGFMTTTVLVATVGNAGYHITRYTPQQLEKYLKIALANNVIYNASITLSKASILLFYLRIFAVRSFRIYTWVVGGLLVGYFLAAAGGLIFAYSPVRAQWKVGIPHTSIDNKKFWLAMGIVNILLDGILLCMPQTRVWKLRMSTRRKLMVSIVFLLGGFVCVASIVRIASLQTIDIGNLTYTLTVPGIWTLVEMDVSIICTCLPTFPNLFRKWCKGNRPTKALQSGSTDQKMSILHNSQRDRSLNYLNLDGTQGVNTSSAATVERGYTMESLQPVRVQTEFEVNFEARQTKASPAV